MAAILAAFGLWAFASSAIAGGSAWGLAGVAVASAASLIAASRVPPGHAWLVPAVVALAAVAIAVATGSEVLSDGPERGPFGYANATGGFYLQASIAGLMLAVSALPPFARAAGAIAAGAFALIAVSTGSAAAAGLLVVPVGALVAARLGRARRGVFVLAALWALGLLATVTVAVLGLRPSEGTRLAGVLDERRAALWQEAVTALGHSPLSGVGPGGFARSAPLAVSDPDARWAHSGFLQAGAETGLPGLGLLVTAFVAAFVVLGASGERDAITVLGAAALAVLGIGASVDYLLHFPAVPAAAAALTGVAMGRITT